MEQQLPLLRIQLRQALKEIEREETASGETELKTITDVENLERKLETALTTLGERKAELARKASRSQKTGQKRKKTQKRR